MTLRTQADQKVFCGGRINFKLESLYSGEQFTITDALIVSQFSNDVSTLRHAVDTSMLGHFDGVHIPVAQERKRIDVLIGQSDKALLTVLEERERGDPDEPNHELTRLGSIASGGRVDRKVDFSNSVTAQKVNVGPAEFDSYDYKSLKAENAALKQTICEYQLVDEAVQPSRNNELAYGLTQPLIKVKDGR